MISKAVGTDVSTFTIYQPSQMDEHILDVLSRYKEDLPVEVISLLKTTGVPPEGGLGKNESIRINIHYFNEVVSPENVINRKKYKTRHTQDNNVNNNKVTHLDHDL